MAQPESGQVLANLGFLTLAGPGELEVAARSCCEAARNVQHVP